MSHCRKLLLGTEDQQHQTTFEIFLIGTRVNASFSDQFVMLMLILESNINISD